MCAEHSAVEVENREMLSKIWNMWGKNSAISLQLQLLSCRPSERLLAGPRGKGRKRGGVAPLGLSKVNAPSCELQNVTLMGCTAPDGTNAIKLTRKNQIAAMREGGYREGTYMGEMRFSAMIGRGKLRSGRQGRSFRSKRGSTSRNQPRKVWQQR